MSILKADKILRPDGETLLDTTGSVLQVQSTHITAYASTTSSSYVTLASYEVSITLSHADNKVLIMGGWYGTTSGSYNRAEYAMYRGSQIINIGDSVGSAGRSTGKPLYMENERIQIYHPFVHLDTPGSVGAHTYSIRFRDGNSDGQIYLNRTRSTGGDTVNVTSTITAMEVKA
tara:strand:+ start:1745 stop:2266 length:522 start_codon:yes stop_codon:yes gene_type:complete